MLLDNNRLIEGETPEEGQLYDMSREQPVEHQFDHIVGNELRCSLHNEQCVAIRVKPTEVLQPDGKGGMKLVDMAR